MVVVLARRLGDSRVVCLLARSGRVLVTVRSLEGASVVHWGVTLAVGRLVGSGAMMDGRGLAGIEGGGVTGVLSLRPEKMTGAAGLS